MTVEFEKKKYNYNYSGKAVIQNTLYNLFGYLFPVIFAIIFIPKLIHSLGIERFGLLSIAWMIIGYISFFDFGIGKSLTKIISEKLSKNEIREIPNLFWSSFLLILLISIIFIIIIYFTLPFVLDKLLNISENLKEEAHSSFYILIFSIPLVTTTTSIRGFLEAYQKYSVINVLRSFMGILTFLLPFLILNIVNSLYWVIWGLIGLRIFIWVLYLIWCFKVNKDLLSNFSIKINFKKLKPVLRFSFWITIANIVGPIILYSDRFIISSLLSISDMTYYSTPYEIATKFLMLSTALVVVLFPNFSASFHTSIELTRKYFVSGVKFIFFIIYPLIFITVTFSEEILTVWINKEFASHSSTVLQLLGFGILFSSISSIPNNFFQGIGKPKIPAILNLIELPFYLFGMWYFITNYSINGAAFFWVIAAFIDMTINFYMVNKIYNISLNSITRKIMILFIFLSILTSMFVTNIWFKIFITSFFLSSFIFLCWKFVLEFDERFLIKSFIKRYIPL